MQDIPVGTRRYKEMVEGKQGERVKRIEVRVGAELAHMMKRHVQLHLRVKLKKNPYLPPTEE
jgi:GTPase Era involved in 16S rRNA processing